MTSTQRTQPRKFVIRVPATSANIGPGFDVVGLSLSLYLTLTVTVYHHSSSISIPESVISYSGEGANDVPLDIYKNLTTRVALYVLRCHDIQKLPSIILHVHNEIPFGRGLGSSGAAVIAGVLLANALGNLNLPQSRLLDFALMVERHPDNVTAALVGGFVGSYLNELEPATMEAVSVPLSEVLPEYPPDAGEDWGKSPPMAPLNIGHYVRFGWAKEIRALAIIPRFELSTAKAREVLPLFYSRKDLVFNMQRLAVLTTALGQSPPDPGLIYEAMKDRVHQPYRKALVPGLPEVTSRITPQTHKGLLGICLSGAGPTILALATEGFENIAHDAVQIFGERGVEVDWKILNIVGGSEVNPGWGTPDQTMIKCNLFYKSEEFKNVSPISGAYNSLRKLKFEGFQLAVLTARDKDMKDLTETWIERWYPGGLLKDVFETVYYSEDFTKTREIPSAVRADELVGTASESRLDKGEMCKNLQARLLIDDALENVRDCAGVAVPALLFGDYDWGNRLSVFRTTKDFLSFEERKEYEINQGNGMEWWMHDTVGFPLNGIWKVKDWQQVLEWFEGPGKHIKRNPTEPIAKKNEKVAALLSMYCDRVAKVPRGPEPCLQSRARILYDPKMNPIVRPTPPPIRAPILGLILEY
ncbi:hypothetical protein Clacol_003774 [Clathrus columnatus]|uniref:Homoserine kinase n=1 Tax=Clathrus columnatus TaxID=1419009 RepID=A0AAV5A953_9AGAM|nr:hypothetical protein Clacol_003774 [Clathrus columnatus]